MTKIHPYLPHALPRSPKRQIRTDRAFGGLSRYSRPDGLTVTGMTNMSAAAYPALATRHPRSCCYVGESSFSTAQGMTVFGGRFYYVKKNTLYVRRMDGAERALCSVSDGQKVFVPFGDRLLILPDKLCYLPDSGEMIHMEIHTEVIPGARFLYEGAYLPDGMTWEELGFRVGDAIIVEEMDGENVIATDTYRIHNLLGRHGLFEGCPKATRDGNFRFSRRIPDGTGFCALSDGKRLAACVGNTVYLCEENNPFNWYCAWAAHPEAGATTLRAASSGDFTACATWREQGIFFKENVICRLTGYDVNTYALTEQCGVSGVPASMRDSLCECDGALYYCTYAGVFRYDGDRPALVSTLPHELTDMQKVCGGSDLLHYHLVVREGTYDVWHFVYTPAHDAWHVEDSYDVAAMVYYDGFLYMQDAYAYIWAASPTGRAHPRSMNEQDARGEVRAEVVLVPERTEDPHGIRLHRLALRASSEDEDGVLTVRVRLDRGDGSFTQNEVEQTFTGWMRERLLQIPVPPTRCYGYRIQLTMQGRWTIHAVTREVEAGEQ